LLEADDREKATRLEAVAKKEAYTTKVARLWCADYIMSIDGMASYAIEYKTIQDFANDKGQDLWVKLAALEDFPFPMLVLEGSMDSNARESNPKWRYNTKEWLAAKAQVNAAIAAILERRKVAILHVTSETDFADWLAIFANRLTRDTREFARPVETRKPAKRTLSDEQSDMVCAISGIGRKKAQQLIERFINPRGIAEAKVEEIGELPGFGKARAETVYRAFNGVEPKN